MPRLRERREAGSRRRGGRHAPAHGYHTDSLTTAAMVARRHVRRLAPLVLAALALASCGSAASRPAAPRPALPRLTPAAAHTAAHGSYLSAAKAGLARARAWWDPR